MAGMDFFFVSKPRQRQEDTQLPTQWLLEGVSRRTKQLMR